jgi:uncharacterized protein
MSDWGHLRERYETERPRKLLALDGGGIRGVLTLRILAEIERQLATATGKGVEFRLGDFFDYIGGTSTGAIIAAGLARGMTVAELQVFYEKLGPMIFEPARLLHRFWNLYRSDPLEEQLRKVFGEETDLSSDTLRCLLLVVTRNATTDSPWPISSNPFARYNLRHRADCNLRIPLWKLVRASTAAPVFFPPEVLEWEEGNPDKAFVFVDGGVTPYNNPAFLLYRMATLPEYRLGWKQGEHDMMVISVGTGSGPTAGATVLDPSSTLVENAKGIPSALMYAAQVDQDVNCRSVGRCVHGARIDRELCDLIPREPVKMPDDRLPTCDELGAPIPVDRDLGRAFLYARYDADLTREGLKKLGLPRVDPAKVSKLDSVDGVKDLIRVGDAAAREVDMSPFQRFWK